MKESVENLNSAFAAFAAFAKDAALQIENGNKVAGTRAGKSSFAIEKG